MTHKYSYGVSVSQKLIRKLCTVLYITNQTADCQVLLQIFQNFARCTEIHEFRGKNVEDNSVHKEHFKYIFVKLT